MNISFDSIRIITFNIRCKNGNDGINSWDNRKEYVSELLNFHAPDIIGLQEVLHEQLTHITKELPDYAHVGVGREDGKQDGEYSSIFFVKEKFLLLDSGNFWLSETPEAVGSMGWDAVCVRIATWVKLQNKQSGEKFFVLNTHFDHVGQTAMKESAKLIISKADELSASVPIIITGDFNNDKNSEVYKILTESFADCGINSYGSTISFHGFSASEMFYENYKGNSEKLKSTGTIDFIFSKKVKTVRHGILSDSWNGFYPSDHFPVMADVLLLT